VATSALPIVTELLYSLLDAAGLSATVYEYVPQNPTFPYVTLKSFTENRLDTFGRPGKSILAQAHVFTSSQQHAGAGQAHAIIAEVNTAVTLNLAQRDALGIDGFDCIKCVPEDAFDAGAEEVDGVSYEHYVQTVRVEVMPQTGA
jgi:hypothetical protein